MGFGEFGQEESADQCWNGKRSWFKVGGIADIAFFITEITGFLNSRKQRKPLPKLYSCFSQAGQSLEQPRVAEGASAHGRR